MRSRDEGDGSLMLMGLRFTCGWVVWLALSAAGVSMRGQGAPPASTTIVEPPAPLLPRQVGRLVLGDTAAGPASDLTDERFGAACGLVLKPTDGRQGGPDCKQLLREDGLARFAAGSYAGDGPARLVGALQFTDATGAFSAFTYLRSQLPELREPEMDYKAGRAVASAGGKNTLIWAGTSILTVDAPLTKQEVDQWRAVLPKVGGRRSLPPLLPTYMTASGVRTDSLHYALGPVGYVAMNGLLPASDLGWDKSLEAATTEVAGKGGRGKLTLLLYPTPQIAGERGRAIEKLINDRGPATFGATVKMRRVGPMLGIASGAFSADQAEALVGGLRLNEEVTFDQKMPLEFHTEVKKTASLLQNIAVLCGVLILAALLLGLFLGGARAGVRVLMGKPAASEPEFLTINLRGGSSPLLSQPGSDQGPQTR